MKFQFLVLTMFVMLFGIGAKAETLICTGGLKVKEKTDRRANVYAAKLKLDLQTDFTDMTLNFSTFELKGKSVEPIESAIGPANETAFSMAPVTPAGFQLAMEGKAQYFRNEAKAIELSGKITISNPSKTDNVNIDYYGLLTCERVP